MQFSLVLPGCLDRAPHPSASEVARTWRPVEELVLVPPLLRSIRRKCSKEPILASGPSFSFLKTFGEKGGASVV